MKNQASASSSHFSRMGTQMQAFKPSGRSPLPLRFRDHLREPSVLNEAIVSARQSVRQRKRAVARATARGTAAVPRRVASLAGCTRVRVRACDCLGMCKAVDLPCVASSAAHKKRRKFTIRSVTTYSVKIKHKTTPVTLNRPRFSSSLPQLALNQNKILHLLRFYTFIFCAVKLFASSRHETPTANALGAKKSEIRKIVKSFFPVNDNHHGAGNRAQDVRKCGKESHDDG